MNPVDEDRALDGEEGFVPYSPRGREAMDPTTRKMVWLASFIALLLAVVIGGWTLGGRHNGTIPIVEALPGPVRFKPVDPGGMVAPDEQPRQETLDGQNPQGHEMLAPPPEVAKPDALRAEVDAARRRDTKPAAPTLATPAAPAPASGPAPDASPSNASPAGMIPVPRQPPPTGDLFHTEAAPSGASPGASPGASSGSSPGGAMAVQLAALNSDAAAMNEWGRLRARHPTLFSGRSPLIEQADHDGHPIYRLRTRGFASTEAAASFCEHARAERVACTVADF